MATSIASSLPGSKPKPKAGWQQGRPRIAYLSFSRYELEETPEAKAFRRIVEFHQDRRVTFFMRWG